MRLDGLGEQFRLILEPQTSPPVPKNLKTSAKPWFRPPFKGENNFTICHPTGGSHTEKGASLDAGLKTSRRNSAPKTPMKLAVPDQFQKFYQKGVVSLKVVGLTVVVLTNKAVKSR